MTEPLAHIEPKAVWNYFAELSRIPRESGNEEGVRKWLTEFAEAHTLSCAVDTAGNVIMKKPASPGREQTPSAVLQGHMDMVCVRSEHSAHDFSTDPIQLVQEGDWITAKETTLGADNGIAIAMALALLADKEAVHGPLEALFTVDEETGLHGALGFNPDLIDSRILINLDSEEEGIFTIGCAGGSEVTGTLQAETEAVPAESLAWKLHLSGFQGGHSGGEIHKGLGNAIRYGLSMLYALAKDPGMDLMIAELSGGRQHNVIPSTFSCTFITAVHTEETVRTALGRLQKAMAEELEQRDPNAAAELSSAALPREAVSAAQSLQVIRSVYSVSTGPEIWSPDLPDLVETSNNLAVIRLQEGEFFFDTCQRSALGSAREEIALRNCAVLETCGAKTKIINTYPGWKPDLNSPIMKKSVEVFEAMTGKSPEVSAIHAGLECGVIIDKIPGMDAISFGPDITGAHSYEERVSIRSTEFNYNFLVKLLGSL